MMAELRFSIDKCDHSMVSGWIDRGGPAPSLIVNLNDNQICDLSPTAYRADLAAGGVGDGRRAFAFPLTGYLVDGLNRVAVVVDGEEIFSHTLPFHRGLIDRGLAGLGENQALLEYSQARWKADAEPEALTWGRIMTGDSLWEIYREARPFVGAENILEIGPGYGRLVDTALKLKIPFASYTGIELSEARVDRLGSGHRQRNVRFHAGDINDWQGATPFDVAMASVTFDFLYPDCRKALNNIRSQMAPGAHLFVDFIPSEEKAAHFEPNGTFIRRYPEAELKEIFAETGFTVRKIVPCTLGQGAMGPVQRSVVVAQATGNTKPRR